MLDQTQCLGNLVDHNVCPDFWPEDENLRAEFHHHLTFQLTCAFELLHLLERQPDLHLLFLQEDKFDQFQLSRLAELLQRNHLELLRHLTRYFRRDLKSKDRQIREERCRLVHQFSTYGQSDRRLQFLPEDMSD